MPGEFLIKDFLHYPRHGLLLAGRAGQWALGIHLHLCTSHHCAPFPSGPLRLRHCATFYGETWSLTNKFPFHYKLFHDFNAKSPNLMIKKSSYIFFALLPSPPSRPAILLRSCANNAIAKKGREHPTQYYTHSIAELLGYIAVWSL